MRPNSFVSLYSMILTVTPTVGVRDFAFKAVRSSSGDACNASLPNLLIKAGGDAMFASQIIFMDVRLPLLVGRASFKVG